MKKKIKLGDLCKPARGQIKESPNTIIDYIDISSVDSNGKTITGYQTMPFSEAPSRARKPVEKDNVIVSTVRPNLNAVAVFEHETPNTPVVSTGFCVLDCKEGVDYRFIFNYCRSHIFIDSMTSQATGASYPAVTDKIIRSALVPDYSYEEQLAISNILDSVDNIIKLRKKEIAALDELIKARFVEMFGDCINDVLIGDVISICRGSSPRPIQAFITDDSNGVNWIKIGDVPENSLYITKTAEKITQEGAKKSRTVHKGDFILSNSMSFGRPYILDIDGCVHDGWLILSDFRDSFDELYLYHALRSDHVQHQFSGAVNGATVKNLNSDLVKGTYIQLPDMESQKKFSAFVKQVDKSKLS